MATTVTTPAPSTFITLGNTSGPALHISVHGDPDVSDQAVVSVPLNQTESRSIELRAGEVLILGDPETVFDTIEDLGSAIKNDVSKLFVHSTPASSQPTVLNLTDSDLGGSTPAPAIGSNAPSVPLGTPQTPASPAPVVQTAPPAPVGSLNSEPVAAEDAHLSPEERAAKQAAKAERKEVHEERAAPEGTAPAASSAPTGALPADTPAPATSPSSPASEPVQF